MDDNLSVAKGVFVHKNGFTANKTSKRKPTGRRRSGKQSKSQNDNLIEGIKDQLWYRSFRKTWSKLETDIQDLLDTNYSKVLASLKVFLEDSDSSICPDLFPVAVLLTGINQPDHYEQFEILCEKICENENVRSTTIQSRDASSLKSAIEHLVSGFISDEFVTHDSDGEEQGGVKTKPKLKKSNCIMRALRDWYFEKQETLEHDMVLAVIIPDFELFNKDVLRDLILTVSYYRSQIPLVLVFGVATTVSALENTLPLQFTSKAKFHVFKSQSSMNNMNSIVEKIVLNPRNHFLLSGKTLQLLVEIFLFYDFSITGFVQGLKFAMLDHFSAGNVYSLCDEPEVALKQLGEFAESDFEAVRKLMSMRRYVENRDQPQDIINLLSDDDYLNDRVEHFLLPGVHQFIDTFYVALNSLHILICDLPKSAYGKQLREIYCTASEGIDFNSEDFQTTLNFLQFSTKSELLSKVNQIAHLIECHLNNVAYNTTALNDLFEDLKRHSKILEDSSTQALDNEGAPAVSSPNLNVGSRQELKNRLMEMSKLQQNQKSPFQREAVSLLDILRDKLFTPFLVPFEDGPPLLELFVFSDSQTLRKHIVGAPRASVHQALLNPYHYLQCDCCELESTNQLTASQPDLSIVYKLHLECGKMINLYDWLQAFKAIVSQDEEDEEDTGGRNIDPVILARFSRAVSELQFLGFIKSSKRKTDHVTRLTW